MSKLATFRIEEEDWQAFLERTKKMNTSASAVLQNFVKWVNAGNQLDEPVSPLEQTSDIEERIEAKLAALHKQMIEEALAPLKVELEELKRGKPVA